MQIKDLTKEEIRECFNNVQQYLEAKDIKWIKYLDLGCKVVRLISYSEEFLSHVEKQLTFVLRDKAPAPCTRFEVSVFKMLLRNCTNKCPSLINSSGSRFLTP